MASSASDPAGVAAARLHALSIPSSSLGVADVRALEIGCEAAKEVLKGALSDLVKEARGAPILTSKSCDGTPVQGRKVHASSQLPSGSRVKTSSKHTLEVLVKNQFARAVLPGGEVKTRVRLQDPVPLEHGKSVPCIAAACLKDWQSLRELGHSGCAIEHYCFDRFGIEALEKTFRQWHAKSAHQHGHLDSSVAPEVLALSELVV
eukprot:6663290-Lingulodinium_polyedra.AAC.1